MARVKYVKERIGEEITDWSQLLHRRQRREERRRLKELERQKELERRREAGEIAQVNSVPADTRAHIPTSTTASATTDATTGPATKATTAATTRPMTRAAARAAASAAITTPPTATTTSTVNTTITSATSTPATAPNTAPVTATAAALPTVIAMAVEDEEHGDMELLDPALFEPVNNENVPQQVSVTTVVKENQKTVEPITRPHHAHISQLASVQAASIPASVHIIATTANAPAYAPAYGPATASAYAPATAPAYAPATAPVYAPATAPVYAPATASAYAPVTAPEFSLITDPATGRATSYEAKEGIAPKLSEQVTGKEVPEQVAVPSDDKDRRAARIAAATQLVPVAEIINRLFAESLQRLQSPTPEVISTEARKFLARAHENETAQAVKKAAFTLSFDILDRIHELQGQNRADRFELASEVLKLRLQQVFLKELVKNRTFKGRWK